MQKGEKWGILSDNSKRNDRELLDIEKLMDTWEDTLESLVAIQVMIVNTEEQPNNDPEPLLC